MSDGNCIEMRASDGRTGRCESLLATQIHDGGSEDWRTGFNYGADVVHGLDDTHEGGDGDLQFVTGNTSRSRQLPNLGAYHSTLSTLCPLLPGSSFVIGTY